MSGSLNKVMLIGNLGRDPELKATPSGQALARFSVATTETWKNPRGEAVQDRVAQHRGVGQAGGDRREVPAQRQAGPHRGPHPVPGVHRPGRVKKTACEIRCDNFVMLGRLEEAAARAGPSAGHPQRTSTNPPGRSRREQRRRGGGYEDDIPF